MYVCYHHYLSAYELNRIQVYGYPINEPMSYLGDIMRKRPVLNYYIPPNAAQYT